MPRLISCPRCYLFTDDPIIQLNVDVMSKASFKTAILDTATEPLV
jgi:hypothetical protein